MTEKILVRFFKRTAERWFDRSIIVEDPSESAERNRSIRVHFGSKQRDTGRRMNLGGFGNARIMKYAGPNKSMLSISLGGEHLHEIPAASDVVKNYIRSMREDDGVKLAAIDADIEAARKLIRELRTARVNHLHDAFARGHVVTVKSLVERAESSQV